MEGQDVEIRRLRSDDDRRRLISVSDAEFKRASRIAEISGTNAWTLANLAETRHPVKATLSLGGEFWPLRIAWL